MASAFPDTGSDPRWTVERYVALVSDGTIAPDDRVELLEGVVVAMAPQSPLHAGSTHQIAKMLRRVVGERAEVREDKPLVLGPVSMPEPDVAVVPGDAPSNYMTDHPRTALLVVEVADSSLPQDRITKARLYAAAGIPEYWIANLRDRCLEIFRVPNPAARCYESTTVACEGERVTLVALPGIEIAVGDLLPPTRGAAS